MKGYNKVVLLGTIDSEVELIEFESGKKTITLQIKTVEFFTDKNGDKLQENQWHRCVCWDKTAELIKRMFVKGDKIFIDGKLRSRLYNKKDTNQEVKVVEVLICEFIKY